MFGGVSTTYCAFTGAARREDVYLALSAQYRILATSLIYVRISTTAGDEETGGL